MLTHALKETGPAWRVVFLTPTKSLILCKARVILVVDTSRTMVWSITVDLADYDVAITMCALSGVWSLL